MDTFWLTFRIADATVGGKSYDDRYNAVRDVVMRSTQRYWEPPTSFIMFESDVAIDVLADRLKAAISEQHDIFLIGMPMFQVAHIGGANDDEDIYKLLPFLEEA